MPRRFRLALRLTGMTRREAGANTQTPGGYWIPAFAGMTAVGVAAPIRLTPAEGANGSRLSGFACGRDDLGEGGAAGIVCLLWW